MAYALNANIPDQVTVSGTIGLGKTFANVFAGFIAGFGAGQTSTALLAAVKADMIAALLPQMTTTVTVKQYTCRQLFGLHPKHGTFFACTAIVIGGTITAVTVDSPGSGYLNGNQILSVYSTTGSGASLVGNFIGGALATVTVLAGGIGYVASPLTIVSAFLPNGLGSFPNRADWLYGATDFLVSNDVGVIATPAEPTFTAYSFRGRSGLSGRHGRWAAHTPGVPEAATAADGNTLVGGFPAALLAAATVFWLLPFVVGASTWQTNTVSKELVLATNIAGSWLYTPGVNVSPLSTVAINPKVGSMLRRKPKQSA